MYLVRRGLYLDPSGTGCVILARHRPALDAGLAIGAALAVSMISGFVLGGLPAGPVADALGWASAALGWWVLIACLILIVSTPGSLASVVGPEAPLVAGVADNRDGVAGGIDLSVGSTFALGNIVALALLNVAQWPMPAVVAATLARVLFTVGLSLRW